MIPIHIPPLRERREDVLPLAHHFLARLAGELGRPELRFAAETESHLLGHDWPGNVRELENAVERGAVLAPGSEIRVEDLLVEAGSPQASPSAPSGETLQQHLDRASARYVRDVLGEAGGKRVEAARRLGIDRTTLYRLMRRYGIDDSE